MKTRRTRLIPRSSGHRDARLFIIAAEGSETERLYFEGLQHQGVIDRRRVVIKIVSGEEGDTGSSPQHIIERMDEFATENELSSIDQCWLVLDLDHWSQPNHVRNLRTMLQQARDKGYRVAVSNPCFELWLLLHFTDDVDSIGGMDDISDACDACEQRIRELCGSFNKANLVITRYTRERMEAAMARAEALDDAPTDRWPQTIGTQVYRLAGELLEQSRRNASLPS